MHGKSTVTKLVEAGFMKIHSPFALVKLMENHRIVLLWGGTVKTSIYVYTYFKHFYWLQNLAFRRKQVAENRQRN